MATTQPLDGERHRGPPKKETPSAKKTSSSVSNSASSSSSSLSRSIASSVSAWADTTGRSDSGGNLVESPLEAQRQTQQSPSPSPPPEQQGRRRQQYRRGGRNGSRGTGDNGKRDRRLLTSYLQEYRDIMLRRYREEDKSSSSWTRRWVRPFRMTNAMARRKMTAGRDPIMIIGNQEFPRLDDDDDDDEDGKGDGMLPLLPSAILDRPYLDLPAGLSPRLRAAAHDVCSELGLFHGSVGGRDGDGTDPEQQRHMVVSVFSDGLLYVPGIADGQTGELAVEKYKPWIRRKRSVYRGGNQGSDPTSHGAVDLEDSAANLTTAEATRVGIGKVMVLVDQPSLCWRDGIDAIDLVEMRDHDLSDTTPPESDDPNWMWVYSAERMEACIQDLEENKPTELAFDLEAHCKSKDRQLTCLIQLATNDGREYVIDVLADGVWDRVGGLAKIFADAQVVKIGHAIGGLDVQSLHRDFGIFVVNAFDTYEAAKLLQLKGKGLAKICRHYGLPFGNQYVTLKDSYQNCDWTKRPLTEQMIQYGRYDVRYLPKIRLLMMRDLILLDQSVVSIDSCASALRDMVKTFNEEDGIEDMADDHNVDNGTEESENARGMRNGENKSTSDITLLDAKDLRMKLTLMQVISTSQDRCCEVWRDKLDSSMKNSTVLSMAAKAKMNGKVWTPAQFKLYEHLVAWRQLVADAEECLPGFVCNCDFLAMIAHYRPSTDNALRRLQWHLPRQFTSHSGTHLQDLLCLVRQSRDADQLEDEADPPSYGEYRKLMETKRRRNLNDHSSDWDIRWILLASVATCAAVAVVFRMALAKSPQGRYA